MQYLIQNGWMYTNHILMTRTQGSSPECLLGSWLGSRFIYIQANPTSPQLEVHPAPAFICAQRHHGRKEERKSWAAQASCFCLADSVQSINWFFPCVSLKAVFSFQHWPGLKQALCLIQNHSDLFPWCLPVPLSSITRHSTWVWKGGGPW